MLNINWSFYSICYMQLIAATNIHYRYCWTEFNSPTLLIAVPWSPGPRPSQILNKRSIQHVGLGVHKRVFELFLIEINAKERNCVWNLPQEVYSRKKFTISTIEQVNNAVFPSFASPWSPWTQTWDYGLSTDICVWYGVCYAVKTIHVYLVQSCSGPGSGRAPGLSN